MQKISTVQKKTFFFKYCIFYNRIRKNMTKTMNLLILTET